MHLAAATTKMKLVANGHPADFHCWECDDFFDSAERKGDQSIRHTRPR
jgi:hypothetical protein